MAQVSEMMFTFQPGKTSNTFTPNRSLESLKSKQNNFKDDLTAARDVKRKDENSDDSRPPLQKTERDSARVSRAERKLNKKVEEKQPDEKEEKKPVKFNKKIQDDLNELLNLLNNIAAIQPEAEGKAQAVNSETLEAVKELGAAVKNQDLNLTGDINKDISRLLDMLKELAGKTEAAVNVQEAGPEINQQVKELVDKILQAQQGEKADTTVEKSAVDTQNNIPFEKTQLKEQNPAIQTLYKLNKLNYELKNLAKTEGQAESINDNTKTAAAVIEEQKTPIEGDVKPEAIDTKEAVPEEAVKPEEKTVADSKQLQVKNNTPDEAEEKLQKLADKKEAVKEVRVEKSEAKAEEKLEIKKAPETAGTDNRKAALDSKEQSSTINRNDQIQSDRPFEKVIATMKTERTAHVPKADVINQIVKKAEVALGDKQSEIRMQLEPENLGKLTLRVAVERGVVTAKFVAESQQVKEIIETNFNQLKDALSEKGINVQSFSVSVGQDNSNSRNSADNYKQLWKDNIRTSGRNSNTTSVNYMEAANDYSAKPVNPYERHDGIVDFKA